jgi:hypothetical protein
VQVLSKPLTWSIDASKFASGWYNVVVELEFSDLTNWIARIRLPNEDAADAEVESTILSEITMMSLVNSQY